MSLSKCPKILQILLNSGANINALSSENESPLNVGIEKGNKHRSSLHENAIDSNSNYFVHLSILNAGKSKMIYFLIERGADVNLANIRGESPLHKAAKYGTIRVEENNFAALNIFVTEFFVTGFISIVGLLIRNGSQLNAKDKQKNTPLHLCLLNVNNPDHRYGIARLLVNNGAEVNAKTMDLATTNRSNYNKKNKLNQSFSKNVSFLTVIL